jgi:hypothetical protein
MADYIRPQKASEATREPSKVASLMAETSCHSGFFA